MCMDEKLASLCVWRKSYLLYVYGRKASLSVYRDEKLASLCVETESYFIRLSGRKAGLSVYRDEKVDFQYIGEKS